MRKIIFLFSLFICFTISAQETPRSSNTRIEPVRKTESGGSLLFPEKKEAPVYRRPDSKPQISMRKKSDLVDPGVRFEKKSFKQDGYAGPGFISDTFLGEIRTGKNVIEMICRDHQYQDGDRVRVLVDDKVIIEDLYLQNAWQGFKINLKPGFNKLEIEALNQGSSGPNTAEFKVMDEMGKVLSQNVWNLSAGVRATMIVIKS